MIHYFLIFIFILLSQDDHYFLIFIFILLSQYDSLFSDIYFYSVEPIWFIIFLIFIFILLSQYDLLVSNIYFDSVEPIWFTIFWCLFLFCWPNMIHYFLMLIWFCWANMIHYFCNIYYDSVEPIWYIIFLIFIFIRLRRSSCLWVRSRPYRTRSGSLPRPSSPRASCSDRRKTHSTRRSASGTNSRRNSLYVTTFICI